MQVDFKVLGLKGLDARFTRMPDSVRTNVREFMGSAVITLRDMVKANIAERFKSVGRLFNSVQAEMTESAEGFTGRVYTQGVPYARIQEYGGTVQTPEIVPVNAHVLAFMAPGKMGFSGGPKMNSMIFTMRTRAHPTTLPERAYARPALFSYRPQFQNGMREAVAKGMA